MIVLAGLAVATAADGRLTDPVRPRSQWIALTLDPARTDTAGRTTIVLEVQAATRTFELHAEELVIGEATVRRAGKRRGRPVTVEPAGKGLVRITADGPLKPGAWELDLAFTGTVHDQAYGLYRFEVDGAPYVASQFQADDARTAWPCFDEPSFKIPFTLSVTVPDGNAVIGNAPVSSRSVGPGGLTVQLAPTPPVPSYALALLVGPYVGTELEGLPVPSTIWTVKGREALVPGLATELPPLLAAQQRWFGTPQPYPKLDLVAVPEFAFGAMENPGAIVFTESIVPPAGSATVEQREDLTRVVAHELAHLWFGDWVTMAWWDDLWLNESFADWVARRTADEVHPEFEGKLSRIERLDRMLADDASAAARPLRTEVDPAAVFESANFAVYEKGEALLDMVEAWIGPEVFQQGLRAYLDRHAWGNARASDLFLALSEVSGHDVAGVLDPYLDTPGAPRLRFERVEPSGAGGSAAPSAVTGPAGSAVFRVRQEPLHLLGGAPPAGGPWKIPVRMRIGRPDGSVEVVVRLLEHPTEEWDLGPVEWLLPAADGIGYYTWSLPGPDLEALLARVPSLDEPERLAVLGALEREWLAGELGLGAWLDHLSSAYATESEPLILAGVAGTVRRAHAITEDLGDPELETLARGYVRRRLAPMLDHVGHEPAPGEAPDVTRLRGTLLEALARAGDPTVRADGMKLGRKALADLGALDPDSAAFGLTVLAEDGPDDIGEQLLEKALAEPDPTRRATLLAAFGRVHGPEGVRAALDWAFAEAPMSEMVTVMLSAIDRRRESERDLLLDRAMAHHDAIAAKLPPVFLGNLAAFGGGCSRERLERAAAFYRDPARAAPATARVLGEVEAEVEACLARREAELARKDELKRALAASGAP